MNRIIIALDGMKEEQALAIAAKLKGAVWGFKVNDLLIDCGLSIVSKLKDYGKVFADPKLHDIPNTVANAIKKLDAAGADLVTVHASGSRPMLEAALQAKTHAKILAVTVLTSLDNSNAQEIYRRPPEDAVIDFARLAASCSIDGIVCSPRELKSFFVIPELNSLIKVIPGIRPSWYDTKDDQKRTTTPSEAVANGATYLVIGRPIISNPDPYRAAMLVNEELA